MKILGHRTLAEQYDLVVVGSGAAGLTSAATAAESGLKVLVIEKSELLGGTSAVSGGMLWVVDNHYAQQNGVEDSKSAGREYVEAVSRGRGRHELLDAAVNHGAEMLRYVDEKLGVEFIFLNNFPDYRQDLPGAAKGGRTVEPQLFNYRDSLGDLAKYIRTDGRHPYTMQEYETWGAFTRFPWDELQERMDSGIAAKGHALVSMLVAACQRYGVTFAVETQVERLLVNDNAVTGIVTAQGQEITSRAVMLASGGFEWDQTLADSMLASRLYTVCSPPSNTGDGLKMAQRIGSATRGTREAWWAPMSLTGGIRDGRAIGSLLRFERQGPGSIMVNRHGQRFANEAQNYNDLARCLQSWDSTNNQTLNTPAHVIFDQSYLERYGILDHRAGQQTPSYLHQAATLEELAEIIHVPADALVATVDRFNAMAIDGVDRDHGRGDSAYDRYWGDAQCPWPNPSLGPLQYGPYYALEVVNGAFGTSGGVGTDGNGRVVDVDDIPIPGLYAAGNVADSPYASGYPGAGATLGPLMTLAYLAARDVVDQAATQRSASKEVLV